jgi:hypothetical protein
MSRCGSCRTGAPIVRRRLAGVLLLALAVGSTANCGTRPVAASGSGPPSATTPVPILTDAAIPVPRSRYRAVMVGGETIVTRRDPSGPVTLRLTGRFAFPEPVPGGPSEGVSADGRVAVLAAAGRTGFAVLTDRAGSSPRFVVLGAEFSYDALSPDGDTLYLVEHLPPAGSEHYAVRAYDLRTGQLADGPIADKTSLAEQMAGHPVSRATSPDGTLVATLYQHLGGGRFVHLLHAAEQWAQCIDLPATVGEGWQLGFGGGLHLSDANGRPRLLVDPDGTVRPPT